MRGNSSPRPGDISWDIVLAVSLGGSLGSLARWGLGAAGPPAGEAFPWATFAENVSGSLALGLLLGLLGRVVGPSSLVRYLRPFLAVGVLGGYTTFSTYALDTRNLVADGRVAMAVGCLAGTPVAALAAVWLGAVLTRRQAT